MFNNTSLSLEIHFMINMSLMIIMSFMITVSGMFNRFKQSHHHFSRNRFLLTKIISITKVLMMMALQFYKAVVDLSRLWF